MNDPTRTQEWLTACLGEVRRTLAALGSDVAGFGASLDELGRRLEGGRFRLAVLGQFKRGKSSLLNALLGEALLPTGILPLTAVPTVLRYGEERRVHVVWLDGRTDSQTGSVETLAKTIARYVTEQENPDNRLGVGQVEVEHPAPLLATGIEIIDTPGIGSTVLHNTRTARQILPSCDGALVVLSPDPPITDVEVQFLRAVREHAARLRFVLTKADLLAPEERDECLAFLREVLHREAGCAPDERIFLISARQAIEARTTGRTSETEALWARSGLAALEEHLNSFALTDMRTALQEAVRRKTARLVREALFSLDLQRKAVEIPKQELERRAGRFEAQLQKIEAERLYFRDRLAGDRRRLLEELEGAAETLAAQARIALAACVEKARGELAGPARPSEVEPRVRAALAQEAERFFGRAAEELAAGGSARFRSVQDTHCREIEGLIARVRRTAADLFEVPGLEPVAVDRIEEVRQPQVVRQRWVTSFTEEAASWLVRLLPAAMHAKRLDRRLRQEIEYLAARNAGELRWTTAQNLDQACRAFEAGMTAQLDAAVRHVRSSVQAALECQAQRQSGLDAELSRLAGARARLSALLETLSPGNGPQAGGGPV